MIWLVMVGISAGLSAYSIGAPVYTISRIYVPQSFRHIWQLIRDIASRASSVGFAQTRAVRCDNEMPEMLDILSLGLSAGLSFDASLELYCHSSEGVLAQELERALLSWRTGFMSRSSALSEMASSVGSDSLAQFCATASEALLFGMPLADAFEQQAQFLRAEQRARIQEHIEEVPVKMLVPLGTLIVPAMLLAILGPLLASAMQ